MAGFYAKAVFSFLRSHVQIRNGSSVVNSFHAVLSTLIALPRYNVNFRAVD